MQTLRPATLRVTATILAMALLGRSPMSGRDRLNSKEQSR